MSRDDQSGWTSSGMGASSLADRWTRATDAVSDVWARESDRLGGWRIPGKVRLAAGRIPGSEHLAGIRARGSERIGAVWARWATLPDDTKYRTLMVVSLLALVLTAPISWNYFDLHLFLLTWDDALAEGWNVYAVGNSNYPPVATYLFVALEVVARRTAANPLVTGTAMEELNWVRLVTRIPLAVGYLWTARLMYRRWGWRVARYWLFTPPVLLAALLVSVHQGFTVLAAFSWLSLIPLHVFFGYQFDLLAVPFTLLALFSLQDEQPDRFGLFLAVGTLLKLYPIVLLPLGLIRFGWRRQLRATGVFCGLVGLTFLPFVLHAPGEFYYQLFGFQGDRYPQGLSVFHVPLLATGFHVPSFPDVLKWLWLPVWLPIGACIALLSTWEPEAGDTVVAFAAVLLSFVMLNKVGNLNYLVWVWPFLLVLLADGHVSVRHLTALVVTASLYPLLYNLPAAVLGEEVFIVQELEWYEARTLLFESFRGGSYESLQSTFFAAADLVYPQAAAIYPYRHELLIVVVLVHAVLQLTILRSLLGTLGGRHTLAQIAGTLRREPVAAVMRVLTEKPRE